VAACSMINDQHVVHENKTKRWCIHTDHHVITGIIFELGSPWIA
jgi:hypothetical protein